MVELGITRPSGYSKIPSQSEVEAQGYRNVTQDVLNKKYLDRPNLRQYDVYDPRVLNIPQGAQIYEKNGQQIVALPDELRAALPPEVVVAGRSAQSVFEVRVQQYKQLPSEVKKEVGLNQFIGLQVGDRARLVKSANDLRLMSRGVTPEEIAAGQSLPGFSADYRKEVALRAYAARKGLTEKVFPAQLDVLQEQNVARLNRIYGGPTLYEQAYRASFPVGVREKAIQIPVKSTLTRELSLKESLPKEFGGTAASLPETIALTRQEGGRILRQFGLYEPAREPQQRAFATVTSSVFGGIGYGVNTVSRGIAYATQKTLLQFNIARKPIPIYLSKSVSLKLTPFSREYKFNPARALEKLSKSGSTLNVIGVPIISNPFAFLNVKGQRVLVDARVIGEFAGAGVEALYYLAPSGEGKLKVVKLSKEGSIANVIGETKTIGSVTKRVIDDIIIRKPALSREFSLLRIPEVRALSTRLGVEARDIRIKGSVLTDALKEQAVSILPVKQVKEFVKPIFEPELSSGRKMGFTNEQILSTLISNRAEPFISPIKRVVSPVRQEIRTKFFKGLRASEFAEVSLAELQSSTRAGYKGALVKLGVDAESLARIKTKFREGALFLPETALASVNRALFAKTQVSMALNVLLRETTLESVLSSIPSRPIRKVLGPELRELAIGRKSGLTQEQILKNIVRGRVEPLVSLATPLRQKIRTKFFKGLRASEFAEVSLAELRSEIASISPRLAKSIRRVVDEELVGVGRTKARLGRLRDFYGIEIKSRYVPAIYQIRQAFAKFSSIVTRPAAITKLGFIKAGNKFALSVEKTIRRFDIPVIISKTVFLREFTKILTVIENARFRAGKLRTKFFNKLENQIYKLRSKLIRRIYGKANIRLAKTELFAEKTRLELAAEEKLLKERDLRNIGYKEFVEPSASQGRTLTIQETRTFEEKNLGRQFGAVAFAPSLKVPFEEETFLSKVDFLPLGVQRGELIGVKSELLGERSLPGLIGKNRALLLERSQIKLSSAQLPSVRELGATQERIGLRLSDRTQEILRGEQRVDSLVREISDVRSRQREQERVRQQERLSVRTRDLVKEKPFILPLTKKKEEPNIGRSVFLRAKAFNVFAKEQGKFKKLNKFSLNRGSAYALGHYFVENSLARSFVVRATTGRGKSIALRNIVASHYRLPARRSKLPQETLIEKSLFTINTRGEKLGLNIARLAARKRKSFGRFLSPTLFSQKINAFVRGIVRETPIRAY